MAPYEQPSLQSHHAGGVQARHALQQEEASAPATDIPLEITAYPTQPLWTMG